jgi:hypothetical protein
MTSKTHLYAHQNITAQAIDYKCLIYTSSIENPRGGGPIPPPGTIYKTKSLISHGVMHA